MNCLALGIRSRVGSDHGLRQASKPQPETPGVGVANHWLLGAKGRSWNGLFVFPFGQQRPNMFLLKRVPNSMPIYHALEPAVKTRHLE